MELAPVFTTPYGQSMFCASTVFWMAVWLYTYFTIRKKGHFGDNSFCMCFHAIVGILFASLSLWIDDESKFSEAIVLCWSGGFFVVDLLDCIISMDVMFTVHGIIGLCLVFVNSCTPFYGLRTGSKGYFVEASTPLYHRWLNNKSKKNFGHFSLSFFLVRIVWTPLFIYQTQQQVELHKYAIWASAAFYLLQCVWFLKGLHMYFTYREDPVEDKKEK
jgi:hypothetical protein